MESDAIMSIRRLNDALRCRGEGGWILITRGVAALGPAAVAVVLKSVAAFDDFTSENDPHGEHDCAVLVVDGVRIIWKIHYNDNDLDGDSPDPADAAATTRILNVMLADEY
jgi:hypothetical protein